MILKGVKSIHIMCVSLVGVLTPPFKLQKIAPRGLGGCEEGPTEDIGAAGWSLKQETIIRYHF